MSKNASTVLLLVGAILVALLSAVFTVQQTEVAVRTQFGEIKDSNYGPCLLYTSPSPRDRTRSRMPSSA